MATQAKAFTTDQFIERASLLFPHGMFDYSKTEYRSGRHPVTIFCNRCQSFFTMKKAESHLRGHGCNLCARKQAGFTKIVPFEEFLRHALLAHGEQYWYDASTYRGLNKPIRVFCNIYCKWIVFNRASYLLRKAVTGKCNYEKSLYTYKKFILQASKVHEGFYNYKEIKPAVRLTDSVVIGCPLHGEFKQSLYKHMNGLRCPKCVNLERFGGYCDTNFQRDKEMASRAGSCYLFECNNGEDKFLKVGITKYTSPHERLLDVRRHINGEAEILRVVNTDLYGCFLLEQYIHRTFKHLRYHTTTVFDGHTECLDISLKDTLVSLFDYLNQGETQCRIAQHD